MYIIIPICEIVNRKIPRSEFLGILYRKVAFKLSIINNILSLMEELNVNQNEMCAYLHIGTSTMSNWKNRGTDPPAKYIIPICDFLNVSPEYLLTGENRKESNISQSAIATGDHSTSTVNIGSQETHSQQEDETVQEITRILNELPLKERTKLLSMIYDFEENYQKNSK